jgi:transposase
MVSFSKKLNGLEAHERRSTMQLKRTIGLDLGDRYHQYCIVTEHGEIVKQGRITNTMRSLTRLFSKLPPHRVVIEAGTHSPWVSRRLKEWGHDVLIGNPRKVKMIYAHERKTDERDALMLARLGRFDPQLLYPIHHRGRHAQADLAVLKARDHLVKARSQLINHVRGAVKAVGERIPSCSAATFHKRAGQMAPEDLKPALRLLLETIEDLTDRIKRYDAMIEDYCKERYPETERLREIQGVGPVTSLGFVLTLEDPKRFVKSRSVPVYLGLLPRIDQSGESNPQLRITKAGDKFIRRLLITSAHYILGPFGEESALRNWGMKIATHGGKNAKKRAVVAVARKLSVILHRLWVTGDTYTPFPNYEEKNVRLGA